MGFYDRDYAYEPDPGYGGEPFRPSRLLRGSIVTTLIAVNVGIFILQSLSPRLQVLIYEIGAMQSLAVVRGHVWRLITAQYLHGDLFHLLFNMIALHFLGRPLERIWSVRRFFVVYTLCGLCGNIFYTVLGVKGVIHPLMPAVGASGCIYGLLGIVAVLFPRATVYIYFLFPIRIRTAAIALGLIAFFSIQFRGQNYGGEACHLAGLVFGVWWAMRGDAWWSTTEWRFLPRSRPRAQVRGGRPATGWRWPVSSGAASAASPGQPPDEETIDRILKKVYDGGIHTLTEKEKQVLQEASEHRRRREARPGPPPRS